MTVAMRADARAPVLVRVLMHARAYPAIIVMCVWCDGYETHVVMGCVV